MNYSITPTTDEDISYLIPYIKEEFRTEYDISHALIDHAVRMYDGELSYTISVDNILVGILIMQPKNRYVVSGILFYILKEYRGTRLNFYLRDHVIDIVRKRNYRKIECLVLPQLRTHNYWKRFGFTTNDGFQYEMILRNIEYKGQTSGYSCGTTVLSMLDKYITGNDISDIDIFEHLNLSQETGTNVPAFMEYLRERGIEYSGSDNANTILSSLTENKKVACLTSMKGSNIPHWILLNSYDTVEKLITVFCPALGIYKSKLNDILYMLDIKSWAGYDVGYIKMMMGDNRIIVVE